LAPEDDLFAQNSPGCEILPTLEESDRDVVVLKTTCDYFCKTRLQHVLEQHNATELLALVGLRISASIQPSGPPPGEDKRLRLSVTDTHAPIVRPFRPRLSFSASQPHPG
jgi:hypothetical protein